MAQTYYTLEEAAEKLGISPADFKKRLRSEWTHIRPLQDGSTQRFKSKDVEELARQIGFGSEEELQLVDPSSEEIAVPPDLRTGEGDPAKAGKSMSSKTKLGPKKPAPPAAPLEDDRLDIGDKDIFLLADEPPAKKSSSKIRPVPAKSDSDVRLAQSGKVKRPSSDQNATTDEIELDILPEGSSTKLGSAKAKSSTSSKIKPTGSGKPSSKITKTPPPSSREPDSSEFELNLDADSSDEFELSLASDSSDEISLGDMPAAAPTDSKSASRRQSSGINIGKPKDAGVSLEKKGDGRSSKKLPSVKPEAAEAPESGKSSRRLPSTRKPDSDEEVDFELSLDQPGASGKKAASSKALDSDSEFDLSLDESSDVVDLDAQTKSQADEPKNDIFETDFEIPALDDDSASEAIAIDEADTDLESSSDFDLAIDEEPAGADGEESGSQVVVLDDEIEEEEPKSRKSGKKKRAAVEDRDEAAEEGAVSFDDMELEEGVSASRALKGLRKVDTEEDEEPETVTLVRGASWGAWPGIVMIPTFFFVFIAGIMAYEMMHSMWGYHQPGAPAGIVVNGVADLFDMKPKDDTK